MAPLGKDFRSSSPFIWYANKYAMTPGAHVRSRSSVGLTQRVGDRGCGFHWGEIKEASYVGLT